MSNTEQGERGDKLESPTVRLLRTIGSPFAPAGETLITESLELYNHAVKNKIPLLYLEVLKQQGKLNELKRKYEEEHTRYSKFLDAIAKVSKTLDAANIDFTVFKTLRPYPVALNDVDILILGNDDMYKVAISRNCLTLWIQRP